MAFEREEALLHGVYEITEVLGSGAFSVVLGGRHRDIGQLVAIKRIDGRNPDLPAGARAELAGRLRAEARLLTNLRHPHLVEVYNFESDGELHLLVMERLHETLGGYFGRASRTIYDACAAGVAVGAALGVAHARGVVHRDIKPHNVLVATDGTFKVADFGIAKILGSGEGRSTNVATPSYAPPEQLDGGQVSPASDVYALGVTLYELLTGAPPFRGDLAELRRAHREEPPPPLTGRVAAPIADVVLRALRKDPAERQRTGREFAAELFAATAGLYGPDWPARAAVPVYTDPRLRSPATPDSSGLSLPDHAGTATRPLDPADQRTSAPASPSAELAEPERRADPDAATATPPATPVPPPRRGGSGTDQPAGAPFVVVLADGRHGPLGATGTRSRTGPRLPGRRRAAPLPVVVPGAHGLAVGPDGAVYVSVPARHVVLRIGPDAGAWPVLGTGEAGFSGDTGSASRSRIDTPTGLAVGPDGALFVADSGNGLIRRVDVGADLVETVAGGAARARPDGAEPRRWTSLDPAELVLRGPRGLTVDAAGRLLIADTGNHRVLRIGLPLAGAAPAAAAPASAPPASAPPASAPPAGGHAGGGRAAGGPAADQVRAEWLAGGGQPGDSGDGGPAARARLLRPSAVLATPDGRVLIADTGNGRVRAVTLAGQLLTVTGGRYQAPGDPLTTSWDGTGPRLTAPASLAVTARGQLVVADSVAGRLTVLALDGAAGQAPAGRAGGPTATRPRPVPAAAAPWPSSSGPHALAVWPAGDGETILATGAADGRITVLRPDGTVGALAATGPR
ncbi:serine/threonine-protein kinase [Pseudofrankia inefficax]|uniref:non-specific serine/threonine protein kinase n=1 Tax=Pseudofrankia inefficax (strain DSM 45817 / CECT 9037 / DDB 130130 / EuI1c) TaxID=298654 RepID=E3IZJ4_PSEI1|nr:serine/threonine-protein kinase [Pseudofrankia inefficax]ADP82764.1 serine/threonine protein kinase [Pseudofrankia inefficax]